MTEETQEYVTPHTETVPDPLAAQVKGMEQSQTASANDINAIKERQAFETYVNSSGEGVPENFKDAGAWFESLKEAQKQYTQSRQEVSDLKAQYADGNTTNPNYTEAPQSPVEAPTEAPITDELRIPLKTEEEIPEPSGTVTGMDQETYDRWSMEFTAQGSFSDETREEIKTRTGFNDKMLDDYLVGQKSRLRETYAQAAEVVGGRENMNKIFNWAAKNLTAEQQIDINIGLASPTYEITLRGLSSMYENSNTSDKAKEPSTNPRLSNVSASERGVIPYQTKREFTSDRNNPKFQYEPKYREAVEQRMMLTDWNNLRA